MPLVDYRKRQHSKTLLSIARSVRADTARAFNARNPASLYCLPAELICEICEYLPIAETFCLMICCSRFWNGRTGIPTFVEARELIYPPHLDPIYRHDLAEIRFHILRLMEFDKIYGKGISSFCCWACMKTHRKACFRNPHRPVYLKLPIEEQRVNCSAAMTRSCMPKCRRIWVGICYEMSFAELRTLKLGMILCEGKAGSSVEIPAGRCFSEHVELNLNTKRILSRFYIGRLSDLGLEGFDNLCQTARIPICPHKKISLFAKRFLRGMKPGDSFKCTLCWTKYYATVTSDGFIEIHVSCYAGTLENISLLGKEFTAEFYAVSYGSINHDLVGHCRKFADWLDRMYNPETGAVFNGGKFEMFAPTRRPRSWFQ